MVPDNFGEELNAPRIISPLFLNEDGTLNISKVVEVRQWHQEMVDYLTLLLSVTPNQTSPLAVKPITNWNFLLDGKHHKILPEQFGNDPRLFGDPKKAVNRVHAALQRIRQRTGVSWYAFTSVKEENGGRWYLDVQAYVRGNTEPDRE